MAKQSIIVRLRYLFFLFAVTGFGVAFQTNTEILYLVGFGFIGLGVYGISQAGFSSLNFSGSRRR